MRKFFSDTVATDTIPLKLVVYLGLLAAILILLFQAWHTAIPVLEDAEISAQTETAAMSILSIQDGYARDSADRYSPAGSICTLKFSLPASVRYISFGVDPDPECNGNLSDSKWVMVNNTIIYQYKTGVKKRVFLEGKPVYFVKGGQNSEGIWIPLTDQENNETHLALEKTGVLIKYPVSGEFSFEMVALNNVRYTMSHF
jgi:hypothetical protein